MSAATATRRKPLPQNSRLPDVEFPGSTPSIITSGLHGNKRVHDEIPPRPQINDDYFDILDTYQDDVREDEEPPAYQEFSLVTEAQHQNEPYLQMPRPQLRPSRSTGFLGDEMSVRPSQRSELASPMKSTDLMFSTAPIPSNTGTRPKIVTAFEESSFFLGGLLSRPVESNRHLTILRHSHGLVYYRGPETSIAISIFSAQPLPPSRRLWLQLKGWSGNTGMAAKALFGSNDDWIDVTPETLVAVNELQPLDERAWQRDLKKFTTKATKTQQKHILRETAVIRIPFEASDGYFRLLLTRGDSKSTLCPSPVFRVASTSMSASCIKGASLTTLPIELGVRAAQTAANIAVSKATAAAIPLKMMAKDRVTNLMPVKKYRGHAQTAWDMSGIQRHIDTTDQQCRARQGERPPMDRTLSAPELLRGCVIGDDAGAATPFPIRLSGTIEKGTGYSTTTYEMPTANLDNLPSGLLASISTGVYFGWALVVTNDPGSAPHHETWRRTIVTISFTATKAVKIAQRKSVRSYLLHEFPANTSFTGSKLKLSIMGYLRPLTPTTEQDVFMLETVNDIAITKASLARSAWGYEQTLRRVKTAQAERGIGDRLVDVRVAGQRRIDRIPVHMLGVRNEMAGLHDRGMYGNGGVWVKRD